jgi:hypothetical protein
MLNMMSYFAVDKELLWLSGNTSAISRLCFSREGSNPRIEAKKCVQYHRLKVNHLRICMSTRHPIHLYT